MALNLAAAALVLARRTPAPAPALEATERPHGKKARRKPLDLEPSPAWLPLLVAAGAGFAGLANEVLWTRALILLVGPTAYSFAFILTAVVLGLALGGALSSALLPRLTRPIATLAAVLAGGALLGEWVIRQIPAAIVPTGEFVRAHADDVDALLRAELKFVLALLVPPMAFSGALFPVCARLVSLRARGAARATGLVLTCNTLGAIAGALAAGFLALPRLGLERGLLAVVALQATLALVVLLTPRLTRARLLGAAAALALCVLVLVRHDPWDHELLAGGVYKYAPYAGVQDVESAVRSGELAFYKEGKGATVSVKRLGATLSLAIDGKVDATNTGDMLTQRLLAHVPLLLHPNPKTALVIGLGSGVTAGAALSHPLVSVDVVEISEEVVEAASLFAKANRDALKDPRLHVVHGDGRNHALMSATRYDVIISEPSNPWMAGVSALFTRDFFLAARARLEPGGVFCQWAHVYNMGEADLKTIVAGFQDAFPSAALFLIDEGDVLLVGGGAAEPSFEPATLARRMAEGRVAEDLKQVRVTSPSVFASLLTLSPQTLKGYAGEAQRHTDDRPVLEFRAPRFIHANTGRANADRLIEWGERAGVPEPWRSLVRDASPQAVTERARMLEGAESLSWASATYARALAKDPRQPAALEGLVRCAVRLREPLTAEKSLLGILEHGGGADARVALALLYENMGQPEQALAQLRQALETDRSPRRGLLLAAEIQEEAGNPQAVAELAAQATKAVPGDPEAEAFLASARLAEGDVDGATATAERVLLRAPDEPRALEVAAIARARKGDRAGARALFERLVLAVPDGWGHLNNFAVFELEGKNYLAARRLFKRATDLNPGNVAGFRGLKETASAMGDRKAEERAEGALRRLGAL
jgi:spermidine synthase